MCNLSLIQKKKTASSFYFLTLTLVGSVEKHGGRDSTKGVFSPCPLSNRMGILGFPMGILGILEIPINIFQFLSCRYYVLGISTL